MPTEPQARRKETEPVEESPTTIREFYYQQLKGGYLPTGWKKRIAGFV